VASRFSDETEKQDGSDNRVREVVNGPDQNVIGAGWRRGSDVGRRTRWFVDEESSSRWISRRLDNKAGGRQERVRFRRSDGGGINQVKYEWFWGCESVLVALLVVVVG
jgi:hypothetical protein